MKFIRAIVVTIILTVVLATPMSALAGGWQLVYIFDGTAFEIGGPTGIEQCNQARYEARLQGIDAACVPYTLP